MGRRKYDVSDEMRWRWAERHRRGDSFSKIGREEGVERKVVAREVRRFEQGQALTETSGARRDVAATVLMDHYRDIESAAWKVLEVLLPPGLAGGGLRPPPTEEPHSAVVSRLAVAFGVQIEARWPHLRRHEPLLRRAAELRARAALEALKEHVPEAWPIVVEVQGAREAYEGHWKDLQKKGLSEEDIIAAIQGAKEGIPPREATPDGRLHEGVTTPKKRKVPNILDHLEHMDRVFAKLERVLNPPRLWKALLASRCRHCPLP